MEHILLSALLMIFRHKVLALGLLLVHAEMQIAVSGSKGGFWSYVAPEDFVTFQQVTVDSRTGNVFAAGRNFVVKLNSFLKLESRAKTGPLLDDLQCHPNDGYCSGERLTDNDARVLEIQLQSDRILYCGSVKQGLCSSSSLNDLKMANLDAANLANYLGGRDSVFAFFSVSQGNDSTLFVANTYDGRPLHLPLRALSVLSLHSASESQFRLQTVTAVEFEKSLKAKYIVRYVYGFEHEGFLYFVTVQPESMDDNEQLFETKLVRVCRNDSSFNSYTELTLSCRHRGSVATFLNVAQAAFFGPVGRDFAKQFQISPAEKVLYISMAKSVEDGWLPDSRHGSGLCLYTLTDIRKAFTKAQSDCYQGFGRLLPWISYLEPLCSKNLDIAAQMDDDFCGLPTNVGIGSRYPLSTDTNFTTDFLGTSLAVFFHQGHTVAVIGTSDGHLMKVLVDGSHSRPYHVMDLGSGLAQRFPVSPDVAFDPTQEHLYILNGPKITRVPLRSCSVYDDCASCVTTLDPLGCGWCDDHCSTKDECMSSWSSDFCTPVIHSFSPRSGPVRGGTKVTIIGQNFGNGNHSLEGVSTTVKVAFVDCAIEFQNNSCIECLTGQSLRGAVEREVKVSVVDVSRTAVDFDIRGSVSTMQDGFSYKVPSIASFDPLIGPKSGGTHLTIYGQHLDVGSHRSVFIANCSCFLVRVTATSIVCRTSAFVTHNSSQFRSSLDSCTVDRGPVTVAIDGSLLNVVGNSVFVYMDDPVITNVFPRISFLSGGIPITVTGSNLHVVRSSSIFVQITSEAQIFRSFCHPSQNSSSILCSSPNITLSNTTMISDEPMKGKLSFDLDGLRDLRNFSEIHPHLGTMLYFIDPVVHPFPGQRAIRLFYDDENYLDIRGSYLNLAVSQSDYRVTIGGTDCYVTQLTAVMILCRPKKPEAISPVEQYKAVQVYVGNLIFAVGSLQYAKRHENLMVMLTAVPVVSAFCVFAVIVFVVWTIKYCCKHQKAKDRVSFIDVQRTGVGRIVADMRLEQLDDVHVEPILDTQAWNVMLDSSVLISKDDLTVLDIIGQGHFGYVYRGTIRSQDVKEEKEVAVKTLKTLTDDSFVVAAEARKFVEEALRMRDFDHPHILPLVGLSLGTNDIPLVVLPFMKHGDLLSYLRNEDNNPTVRDLMEFSIQIADGMDYLASLKFVHRDLAARNCMLDDCMLVKVADFGLARDIYERDYYSSDNRKARLPVKWMALESLEMGIYSTKTDVWSYGIVLWELMTRGICPYPEVDSWDIIKFLRSGRRLPRPSYCPEALFQTMLSCWHPVSSIRPSFDALKTAVTCIIDSMDGQNNRVHLCDATYINAPQVPDYLDPNSVISVETERCAWISQSQMTEV